MFLDTLRETGNVSEAAESIRASRQGLYKARAGDDVLAAEWDDALEVASDALIAEARRRGFEGVEEPLSYQGMCTGDVIRKYSDTLLIFLIKGVRPEYRDRTIEAKVTTHGNATVVFESNGREVVDA